LVRRKGSWGHIQISGIIGKIGFETKATPNNEPKGDDVRWGLNVSSNIKTAERDRIILSAVYGHGIANYMNDGGNDLGPQAKAGPPVSAEFQALPLLGLVAYYDHFWSERWSSSFGYSRTQVNNRNLQEAGDYKSGQYASANLLYSFDSFLTGIEYLWGQRDDKGGAKGHDNRWQITVKYNFSFNR
jgi:hypothetical protein